MSIRPMGLSPSSAAGAYVASADGVNFTWNGSPVTGFGGGGAGSLTPTAVKTANYTAAASDLVPVDTTSGAVTVTLPTAPADKTQVGIKHIVQGGTNAVTVACGGTSVFNKTGGATSFTMPLLAQAATMQYKASTGIWYVMNDDLPLSQLDARFAATAGSNTFQSSQTIHQGYLTLDWSDVDNAHAPEMHFLGYNAWWGGPAIDVANNPKSSGMVTLYKGNAYYINDAVTTSGSPTLTSASEGNFFSTIVGAPVTGPGIPAGTTVLSVESKTSLTMSANATATATAVRVYVNRAGVTDLIFTTHGGAGAASIGLGVTPPSGKGRVEIAGSSVDATLQTLRLSVGATQTGYALSVVDSSGNDRLWVEGAQGAPLMSGNHSSYGKGVAMTRLILAPDVTNVSPLVVKAPTGQSADMALFQLNGVSKMGVASDGRLKVYDAGFFQTTVGAAGAGSALPGAPAKYMQILDNTGVRYVIPCWLAS